ncbi:o-succinylbenzoate synthase [Neiella marina]|uniref:o-succinylbenzoate synthase n=1 Tax=Neiella holothuriorum TaxID=2870530 RepID=A0ABS7EJ12_9GAMM|nr:o-succinylbenzoate synthase [Neiella holothuriorum]MBW8192224.1 o-succinylbenzoate synthase [Neiella holothuriorum]
MKNVRLISTNSHATHNQHALVAVYRFQLTLTAPLQLAHGELSSRHGLLLQFRSHHNDHTQSRWGEASPLPGFSEESLVDTEQALAQWLTGERSFAQLPASLQFAFDMATQPLPCAVNLPASAKLITTSEQPAALPAMAKLKVGSRNVDDDIQRFNDLSKQYPNTRWRLDCNQQWHLQDAQRFAAAVDLARIEFIEEPCQTLAETQALAALGVPVALDETLQSSIYQPTFFAGLTALVCKPMLMGAVSRLQVLTEFARQHQLSVVISGSFESNIGYDYLTRLAAQFAPDVAPGLDTINRLSCDLLTPRLPYTSLPCLTIDQLECVWSARDCAND